MTTLCDCHIHIVGSTARYPMLEARPYTPGPATVEQIRSLGAPLGIKRFVVVQPSFYGADNDMLCDALEEFGGAGRGVAVADPARATEVGKVALAKAGVCGWRINLYSTPGEAPGQTLAARFADIGALASRYGWHVQVIAPLPMLIEAASLLEASPVPVVIDHYGLPAGRGPVSGAGQQLLALMQRPHTPPHKAQPGDAAPLPYRPIDYGRLVAAFRAALPDMASAQRIMGSNAARLYGFAA